MSESQSAKMDALRSARASLNDALLSTEDRRVIEPIVAAIDQALQGRPATHNENGSEALDSRELEVEAARREVERAKVLSAREWGLLDAVLNHSPHGILVCNAAGKMMLQNRAAERIWAGSATVEGVGDWGKYRAYHPDGRAFEPDDWSMTRCLRAGEVTDAEEVRIQRFDGTHGMILGSCAPLFDISGELLGAVSIFADISQFKRAETERERLLRVAQEAVRMREDLLAIVSHDLRSPLSVIAMAAGHIRKAVEPRELERIDSAAKKIERAARSMEKLIRDLLDTASKDAGRLIAEITSHPVDEIIYDALEMHVPLANEADIKLEAEIAEPGMSIRCDRERVLQCLANLLGNALKFTPRGGAIGLQVHPVGDTIEFAVRDSGEGIAPEQLPRVFDRYWQAKRGSRAGAGLGLFIAKSIVEGHGGEIRAESEIGRGTRFSFALARA